MSLAQALVLFDIDGTLLRRAGEDHKNALIEGIRRVTGVETSFKGISTAGMLDCDLIRAMLEAAGHTGAGAGAGEREEILHECQSFYCANCDVDLRSALCPGVPGVLEELRGRGAVMGLVTGNLSRIGWRKMELAGIRDYFAVGGFAEDGATRSEVARVARERAAAQGLIEAERRTCLIGDHPNDIRAARANGFLAVAVATGVIGREELAAAAPDVLVTTLEQLRAEQIL
ncbi:MAG: HAD family hydrolase [Acidobacteriaceae bacterium]|nr:HAD family hydrolase [Acidobacteriaceae bacterium]